MSDQEEQAQIPFTAVEARVLACLMEKDLLTPDNYPLTLNSLTLACNQKSSREPVMNLTQGEVGHTANELADRRLAHIDLGERAQRISHRMRGGFKLDRKQQAILAVLMLRQPQTLNELRNRTQRMGDFAGTEEIQEILEQMMVRSPPLAVCLEKGPGRREDRYAHTLCGAVTHETPEHAKSGGSASGEHPTPESTVTRQEQEARIGELELRVSELEAQMRKVLGNDA